MPHAREAWGFQRRLPYPGRLGALEELSYAIAPGAGRSVIVRLTYHRRSRLLGATVGAGPTALDGRSAGSSGPAGSFDARLLL